ncbi:HEPN domain-containing protein [Streptomyces sp. NPDC127051]|uniref:ApeA N-terminal domain 1-containing protein n=1 Tax=Streptomyces sp. NPDC127051 TaxID=3347119 RepID=UPI003647BD83
MSETISGVWWVGEAPTVQVPGTLVRTGDTWQLDLIGILPVNTYWSDSLSVVPRERIYGACHGKEYTLDGAFLLTTRTPSIQFGQDAGPVADDQSWQRWHGQTLIQGGALPADTLYEEASVEISGLSQWWPQSGLRGPQAASRIAEYNPPKPLVTNCPDGTILTVWARTTERSGLRNRSISEHVTISFMRDDGFTLETLQDELVNPIRALIAISLDSPVDVHQLRLRLKRPVGDPPGIRIFPIVVDPSSEQGEDDRSNHPILTSNDVDMAALLPQWIEAAKRCGVPMDAAEPQPTVGSLQNQVTQIVNAAETLHRVLHTDDAPQESPLAARVQEALQVAGGFNSRDRRKVVSAVKFTEKSLENRLQELAGELGQEFCAWFFDGHLNHWALITATVRNALSHGYDTTHRIEDDPGALFIILSFTRWVIRLRLLATAGLPVDQSLINLLASNRKIKGLISQRVVNWDELAGRISKS